MSYELVVNQIIFMFYINILYFQIIFPHNGCQSEPPAPTDVLNIPHLPDPWPALPA